jgi:hypothetical protein
VYLQVVHLQQEIVLTVSKQKFEKKPFFYDFLYDKVVYNDISMGYFLGYMRKIGHLVLWKIWRVQLRDLSP